MKTAYLYPLFFLLLFITAGCRQTYTPEAYLQVTLNNLEKIESAIYYELTEAWAPYDTLAVNRYNRLIKEFNNPADTTIGASYLSLNAEDTTIVDYCYDGNVRLIMYHENNGVIIDDFSNYTPPFRPVPPPFFNYTKSIIRYMLTTQDDINIESEESADHYYYKLTINEDRQVEFFGKAHYMEDNSQFYGKTTSIYKLWIRKSTGLPYKIQREMSHNVSAKTCLTEPEINKLSAEGFTAYDYIPQNYETRKYGERPNAPTINNLIGKTAPSWILTDMHENIVSSADIKSKVVVLNFTGIGCGPCLVAIPFLISLKEKYSADDFELIAFECWGRKPASLHSYAKEYNMNYPFLCATDKLLQDFQAGRGVPVYVILDENRIVREIFSGYTAETTDKKITDAINQLL